MNYKSFYDKYVKLRKNPEYTSEDILKEFKKTIIDFDVKRWKTYGTYSEGFFVGKMSTGDFQYLMDSRYDFSQCTGYEEFEKLYSSLCDSLEDGLLNDKLKEYIDQRFPNKQLLASARGDRELYYKNYLKVEI